MIQPNMVAAVASHPTSTATCHATNAMATAKATTPVAAETSARVPARATPIADERYSKAKAGVSPAIGSAARAPELARI